MAKSTTTKGSRSKDAAPPPAPAPAIDVLDQYYQTLANDEGLQGLIQERIGQMESARKEGERAFYQNAIDSVSAHPMNWDILARLRPKGINDKIMHPSEATMRAIHDREDPDTSNAYSDEIQALLKLAAVASKPETVELVRNSKGGGSMPAQGWRTSDPEPHYDAAGAKAALVAKVKSLANDKLGARAAECLKAIDDPRGLMTIVREVANIRKKGRDRRALLQMLLPIQPVFESLVPADKRGGAYLQVAQNAKSWFDAWMKDTVGDKPDTVVTGEDVRKYVEGKLTSELSVTYGNELRDNPVPTFAGLNAKFWSALNALHRANYVDDNTCESVRAAMREHNKGLVDEVAENKAAKVAEREALKAAQRAVAVRKRKAKGAPMAPALVAPVPTSPVKRTVVVINSDPTTARRLVAEATAEEATAKPAKGANPDAGIQATTANIRKRIGNKNAAVEALT